MTLVQSSINDTNNRISEILGMYVSKYQYRLMKMELNFFVTNRKCYTFMFGKLIYITI